MITGYQHQDTLAVYVVRNARTREPVKQGGKIVPFASKPLAKAARDALMIETGENFVVSIGPDHKRGRA